MVTADDPIHKWHRLGVQNAGTRLTIEFLGRYRPVLPRSQPTAALYLPLFAGYRPLTRQPAARSTTAMTATHNANPERTGIVTSLATIPTTATAMAIQNVICFGELSFMFHLRDERQDDLRGSVAVRLAVEGLVRYCANRSLLGYVCVSNQSYQGPGRGSSTSLEAPCQSLPMLSRGIVDKEAPFAIGPVPTNESQRMQR